MTRTLNYNNYTVAWIAVLSIEAEAAIAALDKLHEGQFESVRGDDYIYIGGEINGHKIVIATLPDGQTYGVGSAAALGSHIKSRFPNIWFCLLVGVAAGLPNLSPKTSAAYRDIRLGDVLVCVPNKTDMGIVQYDLGKDTDDGYFLNARHTETPALIRAAIGNIRLTRPNPFQVGNDFSNYLITIQKKTLNGKFKYLSQDKDLLFQNTPLGLRLVERCPRDESHRTQVWYGSLGSGNSLMRNAERRDQLRDQYDLIGFEMEAAGIMNILPTGVIRGVCDYADAQKNKDWQPYGAATAAAYAKGLLSTINVPKGECSLTSQHLASDYLSHAGEPTRSSSINHQDLHTLLQILQFLRSAFPNPRTDYDPTSVPEPLTQFLGRHYMRFSITSSFCVAMLFKELLNMFGVHLMLFFYILKQCGSKVPRLLVGADIIFEDVFGEEMRLPYRRYRDWDTFNTFLLQRFHQGHGEHLVNLGQFRLYDYQGISIKKEHWQRVVPNSKVAMSVILKLTEGNICGRCFKEEDSQGSGAIRCSNCGLVYSRIDRWHHRSRLSEIKDNKDHSQEPEQVENPNTAAPESVESLEMGIDSTLGYDRSIEHFTRIDFEIVMTTDSLCAVINQLAQLIGFLFKLVKDHGHQGHASFTELSHIQKGIRSCHNELHALTAQNWFDELDSYSFDLAGNIDSEACFDIRIYWSSLRYEFMTMHRQLLSGGGFVLPHDLGNLLASCADCVKRLRRSHEPSHGQSMRGDLLDTWLNRQSLPRAQSYDSNYGPLDDENHNDEEDEDYHSQGEPELAVFEDRQNTLAQSSPSRQEEPLQQKGSTYAQSPYMPHSRTYADYQSYQPAVGRSGPPTDDEWMARFSPRGQQQQPPPLQQPQPLSGRAAMNLAPQLPYSPYAQPTVFGPREIPSQSQVYRSALGSPTTRNSSIASRQPSATASYASSAQATPAPNHMSASHHLGSHQTYQQHVQTMVNWAHRYPRGQVGSPPPGSQGWRTTLPGPAQALSMGRSYTPPPILHPNPAGGMSYVPGGPSPVVGSVHPLHERHPIDSLGEGPPVSGHQ